MGLSITDVGLSISELGLKIQIWVFQSQMSDVGLSISELGLQIQIWVFQSQMSVFQLVNWVFKCKIGSINHRCGFFNQ